MRLVAATQSELGLVEFALIFNLLNAELEPNVGLILNCNRQNLFIDQNFPSEASILECNE